MLDHRLAVLSVEPNCEPLLEHLFNCVLLPILVVTSERGCRLAFFLTAIDWAEVVAPFSVQLHTKLLKLVVHLVVVLPQLSCWTHLLATERAIELKLSWPAQTMPWLFARLGCLLSLGLAKALAESLGLAPQHVEVPDHLVAKLVV